MPLSNALLALSEALREPPFARQRRQEAYERFQSLPEALQAQAAFPEAPDGDGVGIGFSLSGRDAAWHDRIVSGVFGQLSSEDVPPELRDHFTERFGSLLGDDPASLRHLACLTRGFFIVIPDGCRLHDPVSLFWTNGAAWAATHLILLVGRDAEVTLVEDLANDRGGENRPPSGTSTGTWSHVCEAFVEEGARVRIVQLQDADRGAMFRCRQEGVLAKDARVSWTQASLGGAHVDHALRCRLEGPGAASDVVWMAYAKGTEYAALSARNVFGARDGGGEITMRAVAEDRAHVRCDGMIEIGPAGAGTQTYLTQEVLMLDKTARVDAVPGLEIKTNDVKASHSATVSRVTEEDLFYFASRGIPAQLARRMFVEGFLGDLADRVEDQHAKERLAEAVARKYDRVG